MNGRLLLVTLLVILMIGGLLVGLFANSIEKALALPKPQTTIATTAIKQPLTGMVNRPATATATTPTQMPVTTLAQDTFQRQNQTLWGVASDAQQWTGDANNPNDQTVFSIVNQAGQITNGQGTFNALLGSAIANDDVVISGQINNFTGNVNLGVVLRWKDARNWYKALIDGTRLRLIRNFQGTTDTLGSFPFTAQGGTFYNLRFRALGPMLFAKVWPAGTAEPTRWMIATTDNALDTGLAGVRVVTLRDTIVTIKSFQVQTASNSM